MALSAISKGISAPCWQRGGPPRLPDYDLDRTSLPLSAAEPGHR